MSNTQKMMRAAGFLMAANLISRILGFVRESLMAGLFGKTEATDAYNTAFTLPDLIYWLLVGGVLSAALIPVLSEYIAKKQEEEGWHVASSVINVIFLLMCVLVTIALFAVPWIVEILVPGFAPANKELTIYLTRILLMQPVILGLSGVTMGILNSYKIFWPSALGTILYNACIIFFGSFSANPSDTSSISGFAFGVVIGAFANFLVQVPFLRRVGMRYYPVIDLKHPGVRKILALALPMIIMYALNQLQVVVNANLGSSLIPGSLSAIWYSYRLYQLPVGIFALAIGVAVLPTLSEQVALKQKRQFINTISESIRVICFITIPISVGMMALRFPLIRLLFEHGEFTAADTEATAVPLLYFAAGIAANAVIQILPRAFYAMQNTWIPVLLGLIAVFATVGLMYLLVGPLAHGGLALAVSLGALLQVLLLFFVLRRKLGQMDGRRISFTIIKTTAISCLMGTFVVRWESMTSVVWGTGKIGSFLVFTSGTVLGALLFAVLASLLRMSELKAALHMLRRSK